MKYFIALLMLFLLRFADAQALKNNFENKIYYSESFAGKVKQVTKYNYLTKKITDSFSTTEKLDTINNIAFLLNGISRDTFNLNGQILENRYKQKNDKKTLVNVYCYDSLNKLISIKNFNGNNELTGQTIVNYINEKLSNCKVYGNGILYAEDMYKHITENEIEKRTITKVSYEISILKRKNNKITCEVYNLKNDLLERQVEIEDDSSFYTKIDFYNFNIKNYRLKFLETRINKKGQPNYYSFTAKKIGGDYEQNFSAIETKYDEHKNLIKLITYDKLKKVNYVTTVSYKYDAVGNIIEKLITYDNGDKVLNRCEFEYY